MFKTFPAFYVTKRSSPHSQDPANYSYPKPDQSSPRPQPISLTSILILPSHLKLGLRRRFFTSPTSKPCMHFSSPPCVPHAPPTYTSCSDLPRGTYHKPPHSAAPPPPPARLEFFLSNTHYGFQFVIPMTHVRHTTLETTAHARGRLLCAVRHIHPVSLFKRVKLS